MDPRRFDELTRAMAGATTRRSVLRGVAAGVAGALAGIRPGLAAKPNRSCVPGGGSCDADTPCCRGAVCAGGICCPEARACGGTCCSAGSKCVDGACSGPGPGACPAGSVRVGPNCLLLAGQPCGQGAACQTGFCTDGVCCDG